jgi:demethylmenaquinone methyltransferase/2-methoxy-6-polyprenyl-1,4-benzoquinol methylase
MAAQASPEASMAAYYAARAAEYEAVYAKPERQADLRLLEAWLPGVFAGRRVLEVAAGTGRWTLHGARDAAFWLASDLNPETLGARAARCDRLGDDALPRHYWAVRAQAA